MFSRLYVLIQTDVLSFNVVGIYNYQDAIDKKNYLSSINIMFKYSIHGPFNVETNEYIKDNKPTPYFPPYDSDLLHKPFIPFKPPLTINEKHFSENIMETDSD